MSKQCNTPILTLSLHMGLSGVVSDVSVYVILADAIFSLFSLFVAISNDLIGRSR